MNEPEKQENLCKVFIHLSYSFLRLKNRRILSSDFNLNGNSKYSADDITQKIWLKSEMSEERAGLTKKCCQNL
jgi:hypothetical protein